MSTDPRGRGSAKQRPHPHTIPISVPATPVAPPGAPDVPEPVLQQIEEEVVKPPNSDSPENSQKNSDVEM